MIFGTLNTADAPWQNKFAWFPVHLLDGRWVWLEQVEYVSYFNKIIPIRAIFSPLSNRCYRMPEKSQ